MKLKLSVLTIFLIVPVLAYGQGSGSSKDPQSTGGRMAKKSNFAINRSASGTVASISASSITIRTNAGKTTSFTIKRNTKFVGGRPSKGDKAKITYLAQNRQALLIRRG